MKIISIDPGYDRCGVAVIEKSEATSHAEVLLYSTCLQTDSSESLPDRIFSIGQALEKIIGEHQPELLAIEKLFFTSNQKTVMGVSESKGAVEYVAKNSGLAVVEFTPLQIKIAITGYGRATKDQILAMVPQLITADVSGKIDDEIDAIAVGLTYFAHKRSLSQN